MDSVQEKLTTLVTSLQLEDAPAGSSVVIYYKGELLAHASIGNATPDIKWHKNTLSLNFSTGKGILMTLVHILVSEGLIDYDKTIAYYWPEFAINDKQDITLEAVLTHRAGLYNIQSITDSAHDMLDWSLMVQRVQEMSPEKPFNEGAESCYSALVSGWVLGALIEKVVNMPLNAVINKYLAQPLGVEGEMYFGVPQDEVFHVATLAKNFDNFDDYIKQDVSFQSRDSVPDKKINKKRSAKPKLRQESTAILNTYQSLSAYNCWEKLISEQNVSERQTEQSLQLSTVDITPLYFAMGNINLRDYKNALVPTGRIAFDYYSPQSLMAKIPAANGVASSDALARMYAMLANKGEWHGNTMIRSAVFERLSKVYVTGLDAIMAAAEPKSMYWRLGYHRLFSRCHKPSKISGSFGHMGYDGSVAWCDTDRELAVAFVHNYNITMSTDIRQFAINEAIIEWIDGLN